MNRPAPRWRRFLPVTVLGLILAITLPATGSRPQAGPVAVVELLPNGLDGGTAGSGKAQAPLLPAVLARLEQLDERAANQGASILYLVTDTPVSAAVLAEVGELASPRAVLVFAAPVGPAPAAGPTPSAKPTTPPSPSPSTPAGPTPSGHGKNGSSKSAKGLSTPAHSTPALLPTPKDGPSTAPTPERPADPGSLIASLPTDETVLDDAGNVLRQGTKTGGHGHSGWVVVLWAILSTLGGAVTTLGLPIPPPAPTMDSPAPKLSPSGPNPAVPKPTSGPGPMPRPEQAPTPGGFDFSRYIEPDGPPGELQCHRCGAYQTAEDGSVCEACGARLPDHPDDVVLDPRRQRRPDH